MNEPKKETVRITLPPRPSVNPGGAPTIKKETVRINLPARPTLRATQQVDTAKKETNRVPAVKPPTLAPKPFIPPPAPAGLKPPMGGAPRPPMAPGVPRPPGAPSAATPVAPAAPRPPGAPMAPVSAPRPPEAVPTAPAPAAPVIGGGVPRPPGAPLVPGAPRPPIITGKAPAPAIVPVPLGKPVASPEGVAAAVVSPVAAVPVLKPTVVKKETARIDVPPAPKGAPAPTIRMDRTQPMASVPTASLSPAVLPVSASVSESDVEAGGGVPLWASIAVFALALITFGIQLVAYLAPAVE